MDQSQSSERMKVKKNHLISWNIRKLVNLINFAEVKYILTMFFIDIEKAFDRTDWSFLDLALMGFGWDDVFCR